MNAADRAEIAESRRDAARSEREEQRDAERSMTAFELVVGCRHTFTSHGNCFYCPTTAQEEGF